MISRFRSRIMRIIIDRSRIVFRSNPVVMIKCFMGILMNRLLFEY